MATKTKKKATKSIPKWMGEEGGVGYCALCDRVIYKDRPIKDYKGGKAHSSCVRDEEQGYCMDGHGARELYWINCVWCGKKIKSVKHDRFSRKALDTPCPKCGKLNGIKKIVTYEIAGKLTKVERGEAIVYKGVEIPTTNYYSIFSTGKYEKGSKQACKDIASDIKKLFDYFDKVRGKTTVQKAMDKTMDHWWKMLSRRYAKYGISDTEPRDAVTTILGRYANLTTFGDIGGDGEGGTDYRQG